MALLGVKAEKLYFAVSEVHGVPGSASLELIKQPAQVPRPGGKFPARTWAHSLIPAILRPLRSHLHEPPI